MISLADPIKTRVRDKPSVPWARRRPLPPETPLSDENFSRRFNGLRKREREILTVRHSEGLTISEVADRLFISFQTVKTQLWSAGVQLGLRVSKHEGTTLVPFLLGKHIARTELGLIEPPKLQPEVRDWAEKTFPKSSIESILRHLQDEMLELDGAAAEGAWSQGNREAIREETAGCLLLLMHLASKVGFDLEDAGWAELEKNRGRTWEREAGSKGYWRHVSGPTAGRDAFSMQREP